MLVFIRTRCTLPNCHKHIFQETHIRLLNLHDLGVSSLIVTLWTNIFQFYLLVINFELCFIPLFGKLNQIYSKLQEKIIS